MICYAQSFKIKKIIIFILWEGGCKLQQRQIKLLDMCLLPVLMYNVKTWLFMKIKWKNKEARKEQLLSTLLKDCYINPAYKRTEVTDIITRLNGYVVHIRKGEKMTDGMIFVIYSIPLPME